MRGGYQTSEVIDNISKKPQRMKKLFLQSEGHFIHNSQENR